MCVFTFACVNTSQGVSVDYEMLDISKCINNIHHLKCRDTYDMHTPEINALVHLIAYCCKLRPDINPE